MLNLLRADMSASHRFLTLVAGSVVLLGTTPSARAQDHAAVGGPSACAGEQRGLGAPTVDTSSRAAAVTPRPASAEAQRAAVRLFAAVQVDEVRFEKQPTICVSLRGDVRLDTVRTIARRNLASPVVRGTTYRDVQLAVEILGHLNAECISARITGTTPATATSGACASLGVRDSTASVRSTGSPPPAPPRR